MENRRWIPITLEEPARHRFDVILRDILPVGILSPKDEL